MQTLARAIRGPCLRRQRKPHPGLLYGRKRKTHTGPRFPFNAAFR